MSRILRVVHISGYKLSWWERLLLPLVRMDGWDGEETVGRFKVLFSKMYIYSLRYHENMRRYDNSRGEYN